MVAAHGAAPAKTCCNSVLPSCCSVRLRQPAGGLRARRLRPASLQLPPARCSTRLLPHADTYAPAQAANHHAPLHACTFPSSPAVARCLHRTGQPLSFLCSFLRCCCNTLHSAFLAHVVVCFLRFPLSPRRPDLAPASPLPLVGGITLFVQCASVCVCFFSLSSAAMQAWLVCNMRERAVELCGSPRFERIGTPFASVPSEHYCSHQIEIKSVQDGAEHGAASRLHNRRQLARSTAQRGHGSQLFQLRLQPRREYKEWPAEGLGSARLAGAAVSLLGKRVPAANAWQPTSPGWPHQQGGVCCLLATQHPDECSEAQPPACRFSQGAREQGGCEQDRMAIKQSSSPCPAPSSSSRATARVQRPRGAHKQRRAAGPHLTCACGTRVLQATSSPRWCAEATRRRCARADMNAMPAGPPGAALQFGPGLPDRQCNVKRPLEKSATRTFGHKNQNHRRTR